MKILIDGQTFHTEEINRGIGTYFKNVLENMLKNDFINEFCITVGDNAALNVLSKWCRQKLNVIVNSSYDPTRVESDVSANDSSPYSDALYNDLERLDIDVYWNPNPLMDNVFLPEKKNRARFTCTVHDLIPLVMKDVYFKRWNKKVVNTYLQKIDVMKKYDTLFCVSRSTEADVLRNFKVPETKTQVIYEGVSDLFRPYPFPIIASDERYILYVGGFDPRKNMFKALEAFARLLEKYKENELLFDMKFYIVCSYDDNGKKVLMERAKKLGIDTRVVLTGYVSDQELLKIYQKARCLFSPSLYEGFGLPIVESLACGIPVACSNISSLPEAGGEFANYFDPNDVEGMVNSLFNALNDPVDYASREKRYVYAKKTFSWKNTACETLLAFERLLYRKAPVRLKARKKIAWLSPFPPSKSGIANYSNILVRELKNHADIELFYDGEKPIEELKSEFDLYHISEFERNTGAFDEVFYHIGNNAEFHKDTYKLAWAYPGTVVLHDWNIHPFLQHSFFGTKDEKYYIEAMVEGYGEEGKQALKKLENREDPDVFRFPMSDALVKRSKRVIVHNRWVKEQIGHSGNVQVVPHFAKVSYRPDDAEIKEHKKRHGIEDTHFIIACLGFINRNKLPFVQIEAIKLLIEKGLPVKMVFCGELYPELSSMVEETTRGYLGNHFVFTGYQDETNYWRWLFSSDVILNLRHPTMGEASGTLFQALAAGKAIIVSETCQYREFPDTVCWKVPTENTEIYLYEYLKYLLSDTVLLNQMSKNAKHYSQLFNHEKVAKLYLSIGGCL